MEIIQAAATEVFLSLALGVISLLGAYGMFYISKLAGKVKVQTQQISDTTQRQLLLNALDDVKGLATVTVSAIEQTTAKTLRELVKNGDATREDLLALGETAFNEIKAAITPQAQKLITENLGSFDDYLSNLIETKVLELKSPTGQ